MKNNATGTWGRGDTGTFCAGTRGRFARGHGDVSPVPLSVGHAKRPRVPASPCRIILFLCENTSLPDLDFPIQKQFVEVIDNDAPFDYPDKYIMVIHNRYEVLINREENQIFYM